VIAATLRIVMKRTSRRDWLEIFLFLNRAAITIGLFLALLVFYFAAFFNGYVWFGKLLFKVWEMM